MTPRTIDLTGAADPVGRARRAARQQAEWAEVQAELERVAQHSVDIALGEGVATLALVEAWANLYQIDGTPDPYVAGTFAITGPARSLYGRAQVTVTVVARRDTVEPLTFTVTPPRRRWRRTHPQRVCTVAEVTTELERRGR